MLGRKGNLNKYQRIFGLQCLVSDHNKIKLENSNKNITENL